MGKLWIIPVACFLLGGMASISLIVIHPDNMPWYRIVFLVGDVAGIIVAVKVLKPLCQR